MLWVPTCTAAVLKLGERGLCCLLHWAWGTNWVAFGCSWWQEKVAPSCEGSALGQAGLPPAHVCLALLADESSAVIGKGSSFFLEEPWKDASEHNLCDCWRNRSGEELAAQY